MANISYFKYQSHSAINISYKFQKTSASGCSKIPVPLKHSGFGHQQPSPQMKDDFCDIMNDGDIMMIPEDLYRNKR